ncbi:hypothetical protein MTHERMOG20_04270 [Moorella thermoacetica]|uniref:EamA domain-containing protein n=1 Tax=Moorella thermoacetica (strain ATCC 39073 / JCM 9320) TaxID=264732 RepID=Q2RJ60_MOOTA|nr:DMT family transporter [Moorella thermoacetica]AKX93988.1 putative amino-acid metabolite efflux pump [Moorella thermoacetica]AKX96628.1 putative amino-acid metabolite efflux pump [Moorella thermoacetica]OIQ57798.1 putative amino-acid metabolite efflux pump [Moorella thermoacetica]QDA00442.1 putative amino-acid metabolite efflux pump [Moorella thermoacetica]TYL11352.1 putative amino-acid metabolite efflux pump [Moorella thermoacetica]
MSLPLPAPKTSTSIKDHLSLLLTVTIWASTFINIKIVLLQVPPNTLAFLRFLVASIVLGLHLIWRRQPFVKRQDWPLAGLTGLTGITLYNFLQNQGLKYAGATDAAILAAMAPVFIALLAWLLLRERISRRQVAGIIMAFSGSVLVATNGSPEGLVLNPARLYGDLLVLLTGLSWAVYSISLKRLLNRYTPVTVLTCSTIAGTIFLFPLALLESPINWAAVDISCWLNVLYLGLLASALAYLIWNTVLTRVPAVTAGVYLYLLPVITAIIAALFLREIPGTFTITGGIIVLLGTYLAGK